METNETARPYEGRAQDSTAPEATAASGKTFGDVADLTAFQRDVLVAIARVDADAGYELPHGLAIKSWLERYYGKKTNHGRLYPNLDTLIDEGLVEKHALDKRTNGYTLSERGRHALREHAQLLLGAVDDLDAGTNPDFEVTD